MIRRRLAWLMGLVLVLVIAVSWGMHRGSSDENLVARVVEAVQHNDVTPVQEYFDATAQASMTHERVGRLSDLLAPMGKLKSVDQIDSKDRSAKQYVVHFERGDWQATMPLDAQGKATGFAMRRMQT